MEKGPNMNKLTKTSVVGKQQLLLAHGAHDTKIGDKYLEYDGITLNEIAKMVNEPQAKEKADASFIIASTYRDYDGRNHATQREHGEYWLLALDVDEGDPSLTELRTAVATVTGDASALFYSSSGASEDNRKWRVLIPLALPIQGEDYADAQLALLDLMQQEGITCDAALSRTGQPIYLPNVPPARRDSQGAPSFYHGVLHRGGGMLIPEESKIWANLKFRRKNEAIAAELAAAERSLRAQERENNRSKYDDDDPIDVFNQRHTIADMLLKYGYERKGRSDTYRSPMQSSGSFATKDFGTHWVSLSGSDRASGIGQATGEFCYGDAFDIWAHFEHGGRMSDAVRTYAAELRPSKFDEVNQQLPEPDDGLDDFDTIPDPEIEPESQPEPAPKLEWPTPVGTIDEASLPRRRWIYGHHHIRGFVSVTASAGGIGKTSLTMVEALAVVTGRPLLGEKVHESTNVWIVNLEDDMTEMQIRLAAAMKQHNVTHPEIAGKLFMDAEDTIGITLAAETRDGIETNDAFLSHMRDKIKANNIGLVIIDPFISTHEVNENSNMSVQKVVAMLRQLAREAGCAVHVVHHVRKGNGEDADIDSVRGAGSLIGAARAARVVNKVKFEDAVALGVPEANATGVFRVDDGKANLSAPLPADKAIYRRMVSTELDNGEYVGVAVEFKLPDQWAGMTTRVVNNMLDLIDKGPEDGEKYSIRPQDKQRWVGAVITNYRFSDLDHTKSAGQAKTILRQWNDEGLLEEIVYHSPSQRRERKGIVSTGRVGEMN
jgi:hypothetical protein